MRTPTREGVELVVVKGDFDAADDWIVEHCAERDIVITADIPLADRCLKKGARVLGPRTVSLIAHDHLEGARFDRAGLTFGLGFAVVAKERGFASKGSYFWGGSQGTLFWIDPAEELVAVLMVQVHPSGSLDLRERFEALVYSSIVD